MNIPAGLGVVVTGGVGDIGRAIASLLLDCGAQVTLLDIVEDDQAAPVVDSLVARGTVCYRKMDVRDPDAVAKTLAAIDPLDVVVSNAAIVESAPFLEITPQQWENHLQANLTGCFHVGQSAARIMVARRRPGRIVLTSSFIQEMPWPEVAAYSVTKAGVRMLTRCMAAELAEYGILVNAVAPGIVYAGMAKHQLETEPQYAARVATAVPLGRLQTAEQVARSVGVLCSDAGDYMTGSVLLADGGASLRIPQAAAATGEDL
ncbi:SDR family NAD(P)-dependent oxidoreductase [Rhodococcus marinonascens]|uniref:SDR family NAD(P)-dependent oxidoreductase n=1 Tax=Rhodococcus marinonascens TaxID=38311 RepID=UPI000932F6BC|nr:SDR family oxidoreductase [Rhodococcus marinonascens]